MTVRGLAERLYDVYMDSSYGVVGSVDSEFRELSEDERKRWYKVAREVRSLYKADRDFLL